MKQLLKIILINVVLMSTTSSGYTKSSKSGESLNPEANKKERIQLVRDDNAKKVDVLIDGKLVTSYIYPEALEKPVLFPLKTSEGVTVTRGFPLVPRAGERADHPHHVGVWFNYGDVNGLDFWNNSYAIDSSKRAHYGTIYHQAVNKVSSGKEGELQVTMLWKNIGNKTVLKEETTYIFSVYENGYTIDRISKLTALENDVLMNDNKEGMLGIRVRRELEHPSDKPETFTDANGVPETVKVLNNEGVSGWYKNSEGIEGNDVWGTRSKWVELSGIVEGKKVALVIIDHQQNPGFPSYWHARGYGLFAVNPLGQKEFSKGKEELNFKIPSTTSATFKYRIVVHSGEITDGQINQHFENFQKIK